MKSINQSEFQPGAKISTPCSTPNFFLMKDFCLERTDLLRSVTGSWDYSPEFGEKEGETCWSADWRQRTVTHSGVRKACADMLQLHASYCQCTFPGPQDTKVASHRSQDCWTSGLAWVSLVNLRVLSCSISDGLLQWLSSLLAKPLVLDPSLQLLLHCIMFLPPNCTISPPSLGGWPWLLSHHTWPSCLLTHHKAPSSIPHFAFCLFWNIYHC